MIVGVTVGTGEGVRVGVPVGVGVLVGSGVLVAMEIGEGVDVEACGVGEAVGVAVFGCTVSGGVFVGSDTAVATLSRMAGVASGTAPVSRHPSSIAGSASDNSKGAVLTIYTPNSPLTVQ